jgi:ergothioneine biosynthesis protein EgtB
MPNSLASITINYMDLLDQFLRSRRYTVDLISSLSPEDCQAQSMNDTSPAKWHLAHVTWFYEVMVLKSAEPNFQFWNPEFAVLFNSYYNGVGDKHPRHQRGLLTRPTLAEVLEWRSNIEARITALLQTNQTADLAYLIEIGIHHEQQHQELLLTDIQHLFSCNSLLPAYAPNKTPLRNQSLSPAWLPGIAGLCEVGFDGAGFHFDNEGPRHTVFLPSHSICNRLVTNAQWLAFIESGAYTDSRWWLDAAWFWLQTERISAPLYWSTDHEHKRWFFTLQGNQPLDLNAPVSNISYFEADAYARWAGQNLDDHRGARLPTEFEWEAFARSYPRSDFDLFGKVWQWTSSNYSPYPGYQPWGGIAGEYNGKFMVNQMVLRGSSSYTSPDHARLCYRNFFPTHARWQMTGLRLARDPVS